MSVSLLVSFGRPLTILSRASWVFQVEHDRVRIVPAMLYKQVHTFVLAVIHDFVLQLTYGLYEDHLQVTEAPLR